MASEDALMAAIAALRAEQERRARARGVEMVFSREDFYAKLDAVAARRRAAPGYKPQSLEQQTLALQDLDNYFAGWRRRRDADASRGIEPFTTR
jgi:hypothetical protein